MKFVETILDFLFNNTIGRAILAFIQGAINTVAVRNKKLFVTLGAIFLVLQSITAYVLTADMTAWGIVLSDTIRISIGVGNTILGLLLLLLNNQTVAPKVLTSVASKEVEKKS